MPKLKPMEIGVMFWGGGDPVETIRAQKALGVRCGQLGIPGSMELEGAAEAWQQALKAEKFTLVTVFAGYDGESYADIPSVQATVGFIPPATRTEREARTERVIDFGAALGVPSFACHVGFVPEDRADEDYVVVRGMVERIADYAAGRGMSFALETGQEPADVLLGFLDDVGRANLGINFDPANMILYGTGDPIAALDVLKERVISVHCKDGDWPPKNVAGALGVEQPLGKGAVGIERYIAKLKEIGYTGVLAIEREIEDQDQKRKDMRMAVELLEKLTA